MRIISGIFKGKKLIIPKDKRTRPLKDNVKESIFNILEHSNLINYKINNLNYRDIKINISYKRILTVIFITCFIWGFIN